MSGEDPKDEAEEATGMEAVPVTDEVSALQKERDELKDQLLRRRAEFENYKRRVERDRSLASLDATAAVLKSLVPTLDDLDRALSAEGDPDALRQGVELIRRQLHTVLEAQGVVVDDPTGKPFDPNIHQALSHEVVPGSPDGTVVATFGKGYSFKDRLLRPAMVKVCKAPDAPDAGADGEAVH